MSHRSVAQAHRFPPPPPTFPSTQLAVVGAGWGGAYFAWRLAVDTATVPANETCVFEANGRVGGRIYSIHGLPHFTDLAIDVGGYRFQESQLLPAQLVWNALKLPTTCYDYGCKGDCEGPQNCYVIKDAYGNNHGYATGIERMLGEVEAAGGPGTQVFFGERLTSVTPAPAVSAKATTLTFANGKQVTIIAGCRLLARHCSLVAFHRSLLIPHCSLLTAHSSLLSAHSSLLTPHSSYTPPPLSSSGTVYNTPAWSERSTSNGGQPTLFDKVSVYV